MNRSLQDRLLDRAWVLARTFSRVRQNEILSNAPVAEASSISASMDWPKACAAYAGGVWEARKFRRRSPVMQVVETLGLTDGRHFATYILDKYPGLATHEQILLNSRWGDPLEAPGQFTGWPWRCSPTSLRYLAHAVWLKSSGLVPHGGKIVEVGGGFGGLAAMNAVVSAAQTHIVDLTPVVACALKMMKEIRLGSHALHTPPCGGYTFVSNYAFTELSPEVQDACFEQWIRPSRSGMLISNASHFHQQTGNQQITERLLACDMEASCMYDHPLLGPSDQACGNALITWQRQDWKAGS